MVQWSWVTRLTSWVLCPDQVWCTLDDTSIAEAEPSKIQDKECNSKETRKIRITGKSNG